MVSPENSASKSPKPVQRAVAISAPTPGSDPVITAVGRGAFAEKLLELAFEHDVKVREDAALAEILSALEVDSLVPTEALEAVAEILSYLYRLDGRARSTDPTEDQPAAATPPQETTDQESND
jgi:flagellar biosynthesis protein